MIYDMSAFETTLVMSARTTTVEPEDIGAAIARAFQGWHVSNQAAMGRTLTALILKHSGSGALITEHIQATGAVRIEPNSEPAAVNASTLEPWITMTLLRATKDTESRRISDVRTSSALVEGPGNGIRQVRHLPRVLGAHLLF